MRKLEKVIPGLVGVFWFGFFFLYSYRELIDDVNYRGILENRYFHYADGTGVFRPLHHGLLYLQGWFFEPEMSKAMVLGLLLHLLIGVLVWRWWLPKLSSALRAVTALGLLAFLVHPVSLQTVVHVAQRGEILGTLFLLLGIGFFRSEGRSLWLVAGSGLCALLSKENYVLPSLVLLAVAALEARRSGSRRLLVQAGVSLAVLGALAFALSKGVEFSDSKIQTASRFEKSRVFRQAVADQRQLEPAESIELPSRSLSENVILQTSLLPKAGRLVVLPFGMLEDLGQFPFGKMGNRIPWFWFSVGLMFLAAALGGAWLFRKERILPEWAMIFSPLVLYSVYWAVPVYDPLMTYRLYGVVFLFFVFSLPLLLAGRGELSRKRLLSMAVLVTVIFMAGAVRAYEMRTKVSQTTVELARSPLDYRVYRKHVLALVLAKKGPVACEGILQPALKLTPTPAAIYTSLAWCLVEQGKKAEAAAYARRGLRYEASAHDTQILLGIVLEQNRGDASFSPGEVHPSNVKHLVPSLDPKAKSLIPG